MDRPELCKNRIGSFEGLYIYNEYPPADIRRDNRSDGGSGKVVAQVLPVGSRA
jgi:hypothetical protein